MGGNFWKLDRMARVAYLDIEDDLRRYLDEAAPGQYRIPEYCGDKATFGDLDVLLSSNVLVKNPQFYDTLHRDLGITQFDSLHTGHTTVYRGLQVDFFIVSPDNLKSSYNFMSYGELGNIIGRMVKRFDCKWGGDGLTFIFRWGDHFKREVNLTKNFEIVCECFCLNYDIWSKGFATQRDSFIWATNSMWFRSEPYFREDGPVANRIKTRTGMIDFVAFVKSNFGPNSGAKTDDPIGHLEKYFPGSNLREKISKFEAQVKTIEAVSAKFNGRYIMGLRPGLAGKELGDFISKFKASKENFEEWVIGNDQPTIDSAVLGFVPNRSEL